MTKLLFGISLSFRRIFNVWTGVIKHIIELSKGKVVHQFSTTIQKSINKIIKRYPLKSGQCHQCAQKLVDLFTKEGFRAKIGHMETSLPALTLADGTYLSHRPRGSSSLAYHEFVRVGDHVYDSITGPQGLHWDDYQKLFYEGVFDDGIIRVTYL